MMLNLLSAGGTTAASATTTATKPLPSGMKSTTDVANAALTATTGGAGMGQKDFLTLFTTQLKNQDPTDPVKNEAFVAQLAQFSQLEATTGMATSLSDFVSTMSGTQMTTSASLIGKKVSVPDGPAVLDAAGTPVQGVINLPAGADGVTFNVYNSQGILVDTQILGAQTAGDMTWAWDGNDSGGNYAPAGTYRFTATAVSQGKTTYPSISTMATVQGVSQASDKTMLLQIQGGKTVKLTDVTRVDG